MHLIQTKSKVFCLSKCYIQASKHIPNALRLALLTAAIIFIILAHGPL